MYNCKRKNKFFDLSNDLNKSCSSNSIRSTCGAWRFLDGAWVPAPAVCKSSKLFNIKEQQESYSSKNDTTINNDVSLTIPEGDNHATEAGVTFSSNLGNKLSFSSRADYSGTPVNMKILIEGVQKGLVTFTTAFLGDSFVFFDETSGLEYQGIFTASGSVEF